MMGGSMMPGGMYMPMMAAGGMHMMPGMRMPQMPGENTHACFTMKYLCMYI